MASDEYNYGSRFKHENDDGFSNEHRNKSHREPRNRYRRSRDYNEDGNEREFQRSKFRGLDIDRSRSSRHTKSEDSGRHSRNSVRDSSHSSPRSGSKSPERPNYMRSGLLALETNRMSVQEAQGLTPTISGSMKPLSASDTVVLKYHEPHDRARQAPKSPRYFLIHMPDDDLNDSKDSRWNKKKRNDNSQTIRLDQLTYYLIGSDSRICHILLSTDAQNQRKSSRPVADQQHAVIQYRVKNSRDKYGETQSKTIPYLIDLESSRGTYLNGDKIPPASYVELRNKDIIEFGRVPDQYIFMKDES